MRLLIVLEYFYNVDRPVGGAERQVNKLAKKFIEAGLDVTLVAGQWKWQEPRQEVINTILVSRIFTFWNMFDTRGLRKFGHYTYLITLFFYLYRNRKNYDFIHCHSAMVSAFVIALAGKWFNKKTLARPMASGEPWGDVSRMKSQQSVRGSQYMLKRFKDIDIFIALNQEVIAELTGIGVDPRKVVLLPNGVETEGVKNKQNYQINSAVTVTFVGRLHHQKNIDCLLLALKKALTKQKFCLQLVGTGPLRADLEQQAQTLGIDKQVKFFGQIPDVSTVLYNSDIFVLPSRAEGMSNALLEAMTYGLPCIASNILANAALIEDGKTGLLTPVGDPDALAEALVKLAEDQTWRETLGQAARQTILDNYSISRVAERYMALYQKILQEEQ